MADLYARLKKAGLKRKFVRECLLPEWWEDALGEVPANIRLIELTIAQVLGLNAQVTTTPKESIHIAPRTPYRLKQARKDTPHDAVALRVALAERAALTVKAHLHDLPRFEPCKDYSDARSDILADNEYVNLSSLVRFCWSSGIVVLHVNYGAGVESRNFHGVTFYPERNPIIVLASGRDSPPWLAFYLAHELGHLSCRHLSEGGESLVDAQISVTEGTEKEEREAHSFAMRLLTGREEWGFKLARLPARRLAEAALVYGEENNIDPGTCVLIYGYSCNKWPVAQQALKILREDAGAQSIIKSSLLTHLRTDELSEGAERFLNCVLTEGDD